MTKKGRIEGIHRAFKQLVSEELKIRDAKLAKFRELAVLARDSRNDPYYYGKVRDLACKLLLEEAHEKETAAP